jgi:MFS family permease
MDVGLAKHVDGPADAHQGPGRRAILAVTIGNAIEFYDFLIYSMFAIQIGHALFPPMDGGGNLVASLAGFGIGFLARPVGALVIGRWSDRKGRKPAMVAAMLLIGVANAGLALIPDFATIGWAATVLALFCRLLAGFALGGELGCNSAYLAEASAPHNRAVTVSWQGLSQSLGFAAAGAVAWLLADIMTPEDFAAFGWRIGVASGLVAIPVALWLRADLAEPLPPGDADPVAAPISAAARNRLLLGCFLLLGSGTIGNYLMAYTTTFAQDSLGLSPAMGSSATTAGFLMAAVALVVGGWLADRIGRRPVLIAGAAVTALAAWPGYAIILAWPASGGLVAGTLLLSAATNINTGALYTAMTEGMPRRWRGAGFGLLYAGSVALFGASTQPVTAWALHRWQDPMLLAWVMLGIGLVQIVAAAMVPETRPQPA